MRSSSAECLITKCITELVTPNHSHALIETKGGKGGGTGGEGLKGRDYESTGKPSCRPTYTK